MTNTELLKKLADDQGMTIMELLEQATYDYISPGICIECGHITDSIEPDCHNGYCDNCHQQTIKSCLVLAGII